MATLMRRSFDDPDELQEFPKIKVASVRLGDLHVKRLTVEPGWRWSEHVGPVVGSDAWVVGDESVVGIDVQAAAR
jgi:hypothetical protein